MFLLYNTVRKQFIICDDDDDDDDDKTQWSKVPLQLLIVIQLVKKLPTFYGIRRFITMFTRVRHCSYPELDSSSPHPTLFS